MLGGAALVAGALLTRAIAPPFYGGLTLLGLTALAAYTALSITLVARRRPTRGSRRAGRSPTWRRSRARWRWCGSCRGAGRRC